jgi:hypothetical protein
MAFTAAGPPPLLHAPIKTTTAVIISAVNQALDRAGRVTPTTFRIPSLTSPHGVVIGFKL